MCKKFICLIPFVLIFALSGSALAVTIDWDGGGATNLWNVPENWVGDTEPNASDTAQINIVDANALIDASVAAECYAFYVGYDEGPCYLKMTGGTLTAGGTTSRIGSQGDSNGVFILSGGTVDLQGKRLWIGYNGGANGTLIITGGEMTVGDKIECGKQNGGTGAGGLAQIIMEGGVLNLAGYGSDDFEIGNKTDSLGIVTMTGGEINITDNIKLGQGGGTGIIYLYGGVINNGNGEPLIGDNAYIDITEGELVLPGNALTAVNDLVGVGKIKAYDGLGRVVATYDAGDDETTVRGTLGDPNLAWMPNPSDHSTIDWTPDGPTLSWLPGENADKHDVYFGSVLADVNDANRTVTNGVLLSQGQDPCSYGPVAVDIGTTYYWRIDEVNGATIWKGDVWQFTVNNYIIVDNMDEYGDDAEAPGEPGGCIYYVWRDGWDISESIQGNDTGSQVYHWNDYGTDLMESTIVRSGVSMPYYYENDGDDQSKPYPYDNPDNPLQYYSEASVATSNLTIGSDWTAGDVEALSLWFYGDPNNDADATEQMYVKLNNSKITYNGSMSDIKEPTWHEWNIKLADFGINLNNVTSLSIGFGDETNTTTPGGAGIVYFDDIRLYPARCIPSILQPDGDLDDDCDADYDDLDIMAEDWLLSDYTGPGSDGILMNFPTDDSQWVNDPCRGRSLEFDGLDDWVNLADDEFSNFQDKTISLWVRIGTFGDPYPYVFCFQNAGTDPYRIYFRTRGTGIVRIHFVDDYLPNFTVGTNDWHHLAFVVRNTGSNTCSGEYYGDGTFVGEMTGQPRHTGGAKGVNIGCFNDGTGPFLDGAYDEFRVYDDALDLNEIKYLAGVSGGVAPTAGMLLWYKFDETSGQIAANSSTYEFNRPLTSVAELYAGEPEGSRKVNFKDFAVMAADSWFEGTLLWP